MDIVLSLLEQYEFQVADIVPYTIKRKHPQAWTQRIQIHNIQTNDSRAVKIYLVNQKHLLGTFGWIKKHEHGCWTWLG
jgi:hypothetical protein